MQKYGLIGYPLGHSFSRNFFNQKFEAESIDAQYINFEIPTIKDLKRVLKENHELHGLNVTIPYKEQVIPYLDDLDDDARQIGAVNVIKFEKGRFGKTKLVGYNSDVIGFRESIEPLLNKAHAYALILGTGGASKAVFHGLKQLGIESAFVSRTKKENSFTYEELTPEVMEKYTVIVNTTPLGMFPNVNECPHIPYDLLTPAHLLYDLLYNLMIPGIDVDKRKGTVSSFKGTVSLYIDGKKADYREVQNLQPKDIEKVEYFDMPTGQYMGETEVINYITKKKETGGYVAVDGTQNIGYLKGDYNAVVKVNHKNTSYSFFGGYSMEKYSDKASKQEIFHFQDGDINRNTKTQDAQTKDNQQYFQAIINNSTDKRTLNGKVSLVHTDAPDNYSMNQVQYVTDANGTTSTNRTDTKSWMPSIELYGYFKLDAKQALSAMLKGNYTNNE